jgi:cytochrome oxidase Cu insertion factor (SCO1/SenC/PrrC family)
MPKQTPKLAEAFKVDENELQPKPKNEAVKSISVENDKPKKRHIGGYFNDNVYRQMKHIGVENDMTTQDILAEALNAFFRMHDKPPIA